MKSFSQFINEAEDRTAQQAAVSAHQARTGGMRRTTSGTVGGRGKQFKKRPATGVGKFIRDKVKSSLKKPTSSKKSTQKPTQTIEPKTKPNPITKGLGARPA
tara:strand:- start:928 stop:1233 length:306 start_codon:yes stop_codon:yes gene_type:complete